MSHWIEHLDARHEAIAAEGLARELRVAEGAGVRLTMRGREVISFGSNDYLGLSTHPRVIAAAKEALDKYGAGATASALICGNKTIHDELASAVAKFKDAERALILPSGYQAALAVLTALADDQSSILLDKLAHASLIDGARLSGARVRSFHHSDLNDLKRLLEKERPRRCIIVTESLYSMDGDLSPHLGILALAVEFDALMVVDEAHATGVMRKTGRGALSGLNHSTRLVVVGTFSKALGAQGGFVCGPESVMRAVLTGRAHMFSTALAPASAAAALEALKLIDDEPWRRERLAEHSVFVRGELQHLKIETPSTHGPIVPAIIGDEGKALECAETLFERGFFVPAVRYPTVKKGQARLRISLSAAHERDECAALMRTISDLNI